MYFESLDSALKMAGHGPFVWSAYGITLLVILSLIVLPLRRVRATQRQIRAEMRRQRAAKTPTNGTENAPKA